jgi:hypothetical protein
MKELDFQGDLKIEETALDVECLNQPRLMMKYSEEYASVQAEMADAKEELDVFEAKADAAIRNDPEKYGITKITEAAVKAAILLDEDCAEKRKELRRLKEKVDLISGAVRSVDARKKMLELLVQLYGQQYFAGPKIPRDIHKEARARFEQESSNEKVKKAMKRKGGEDD